MPLVLELDVADLAATRFAISPLSETLRAVQLLAGRHTPAVNAPWLRWARRELGWRPLHRGGLVDKRRSGRVVLYQTTALGLALLGDGPARSGADGAEPGASAW
jgi:hypothetical protein